MRHAILTLALASVSLGLTAAPKQASKRAASKTSDGSIHVLRKGETAAQVARKHGLSLTELADLNPGRSLSKLPIGARLVIRARAVPEPRPEASAVSPIHRPALAALPLAPAVVPTPMPHLERLLPYQVHGSIPSGGPISVVDTAPHQNPATTERLLARMQQVLPPVTESELKALLPTFTPADPEHLDLLWPVETRTISSAWGPRMRTKTIRVKDQRKKRIRYKGRHKGVDLTAPLGTSVFAAMDGQVITSGRHKQYGNYVVLDHGNGVSTVYAHHRLNLIHEGDIVRRGQKIAEVGRTGNATGPHLHFELRIDGLQQNPLPALNDTEEIPVETAAQNALLGATFNR
jgi:murein DD-endopeptidase MepM/ murein hydrolase activator NlpD